MRIPAHRFLALCVLLAAAASETCAATLEYEGFSLDTDLSQLMTRFPRAAHEFWYSDGLITTLTTPAEADKIRDSIARGSGEYIVRLSKGQTAGRVNYISARIAAGRVSRLMLSFDIGTSTASGLANFETRHPACPVILKDLGRRFGSPPAPEESGEERLEKFSYSWRRAREEMILVCGRYQGRRAIFAMELIIGRLPD